MVGHARFSPWQFRKADLQMGHLLELALKASPATDKAFCDSDSFRHRTRIEGSFEGHHSPEHPASTPKLMKDIESMQMREKLKRWDRASTAPNKKRLSPCLLGPSFLLMRPAKAPCSSGGLLPALKKRRGERDRWGYI